MAQAKQQAGGPSGNVRALVFLGLAVLAGLAAVVLIYRIIDSYKQAIAEASAPPPTAVTVVAAGDLYPGIAITESDLVQVEVPTDYLPTNEAGELSVFTAPQDVVGRIPRERILSNEFILADRLADPESGLGLNVLVESGMRAISLNIQNGAAVSGFLQPGNRVDLIVTVTPEDGGAQPETLPLLQAVEILAVNDRINEPKKPKVAADPNAPAAKPRRRAPSQSPSVTLMVTPDQAELAAHAARVGRIMLSLRGNSDVMFVAGAPVETSEFFKEDHPPEAPKPEPKKVRPKKKESEGVTLQVIRAGVKSEYKQPAQ
jgi:pilus assembly protein CpaB